MRWLAALFFLLSSCTTYKPEDIPSYMVANSGAFVFLEAARSNTEGFTINRKNKNLLVYGLPFVDQDTILTIGEYEVLVLRKDYGESRIEISDDNLVSPKLADQERASAEYLKVRKIIKGNSKQLSNDFNFVTPIESVITSAFGKRRYINGKERSPHMALDIRGKVGREIFAPKKGKVVLAETHFYGGNKIILDHGGGLFTAYSHMSSFEVELGDVVEAGEIIGFVGMTGRVTGPHLHWEVFLNENRINPELLIDLDYAQD